MWKYKYLLQQAKQGSDCKLLINWVFSKITEMFLKLMDKFYFYLFSYFLFLSFEVLVSNLSIRRITDINLQLDVQKYVLIP